MSDKKWSCKWTGSGRRGRCHKGKEYPRHALQYYDGTHLSMRKRIYSKSIMGSVWREGRAAIPRKYIIGLLNKYVGKTYEELKFAYDQRTKNLTKKYNICWNKLEDFLYDEPPKKPWRDSFYVDDEGIVRKAPLKARHRRTLTKRQWEFNKKVRIPDFGQCRDIPKYAATRRWGYAYNETGYSDIITKMQIPLLLGTFWINYENRIFKIPIYTCCNEIMRDYSNYNGWTWVKGKQVRTPFHNSRSTWHKPTNEWIKKAMRVEKEWIPINVWGLPSGQSHMMRLPSYERTELIHSIEWRMKKLAEATDPIEIGELQSSIDRDSEKVDKMPEICLYDMGYGKFYTFMKRVDYEQFLNSIKRETA
ncbi:MAG: hypothetical protein IJ880_17870 [Bacilli bacterium]|nr:hypothetical protein [Bacilli bacterium]